VDEVSSNPDQPRRLFADEELRSLADSIKRHGLLQPLVVVRGEGGYRLIAGERRLRAARLAGMTEVPVFIREAAQGEESLALSLVENIQRHDLNALEEADAYRRLTEEFGHTQEAVARQVGHTQAHVGNTLRLLGLVPAVKSALQSGSISAGHARALAGLHQDMQEDALRRVLRDDLNVRQTEQLVRESAGRKVAQRRPRKVADAQLHALEAEFARALGTRVSLSRNGKKGRLVIEFFSDEELDALYRRLVEGQR
jgi:ParB family chromosome partitioning protein